MTGELRAVVVEDEPMIRRGIARMVAECGGRWTVAGTFANGGEALEYLKTPGVRIDLLVTDVKMPMMDGLTLIKEAKRYQRFLPLVVSGYDDFEYVRTALREGAIDYILKPVNRGLFREQMKEIERKITLQKRQEELAALRSLAGGAGRTAEEDAAALFPAGTYRLLLVSPDEPPLRMRTYSTRDWALVRFALQNIAEESAEMHAGGGDAWVWEEERERIWVLARDPADAEALAEFVRSAAVRYLGLTVTVAVGGAFDDLNRLSEERSRALSLLYLRLSRGGNRVFLADRLPAASDRGVPSGLVRIGQRLRLAVGRDPEEVTAGLLHEYLDALRTLDHPEAVRQALSYLVSLLSGLTLEAGLERTASREISELARELQRGAVNLAWLEKRLNRVTALAGAAMRGRREDRSRPPVERVKDWIRLHLSESLTIQAIAAQIPMNPTYFSEWFKAHTGETVLDFVTRLRMEEAARLLADPGSRLGDVAAAVGYRDVNISTASSGSTLACSLRSTASGSGPWANETRHLPTTHLTTRTCRLNHRTMRHLTMEPPDDVTPDD